jgi:hypothetical protein
LLPAVVALASVGLSELSVIGECVVFGDPIAALFHDAKKHAQTNVLSPTAVEIRMMILSFD